MTVMVLGCLWVLAVTAIAMLPMRRQFVPGIVLLMLAPVLIWMLWQEFGWMVGCFGIFALFSMFRRPVRFYTKKFLGQGDVSPEREGT